MPVMYPKKSSMPCMADGGKVKKQYEDDPEYGGVEEKIGGGERAASAVGSALGAVVSVPMRVAPKGSRQRKEGDNMWEASKELAKEAVTGKRRGPPQP